MFLKDPKTGEKSVTLTLFVVGFLVCTLKLLLSGVQLNDKVKMDPFNGVDYGAALGALGGIYALRRSKDKEE